MDILSAKVVTVSETLAKQLAGPIPVSKIRVIHNGVEGCPEEPEAATALRAELGIDDDTAIAISIGSLIREKGYDNLLEAAVRARQKGGGVAFVIVGGGEEDAVRELTDKIKEKDLEGAVHYLGYRGDIARILAGADLLVLPSLSEAFSLVVLEAMSAGKPIVATDCGGPAELLVDGETGFLVPVGDSVALCDRVLTLVADKVARLAMGARGKARFDQLFTATQYAANFTELYREVVANRAAFNLKVQDRIFLKGMMDTYQRISENALKAGIRHELPYMLKRIAMAPLKLIQVVLNFRKKKRR